MKWANSMNHLANYDGNWLNIALWAAVWKKTTQMLYEKFNWKFYVLMKTTAYILLQKDRTRAIWYAVSIINKYKNKQKQIHQTVNYS